MPSRLNARQRALWKALVPKLTELVDLAAVDAYQLERYVCMLSRYEACEAVLNKHGLVYETKNTAGETVVKARPEATISKSLHDALCKTEARFGMTPTDRRSLDIVLEKPKATPGKRPDNILDLGL